MIRLGLLCFMGALTLVVATDVESSTRVTCTSPFTLVGSRCLHIEHISAGTWYEMRQLCQDLGGDLVNLSHLPFYGDLILYLKSLHLPQVDLWIGASDEGTEGVWVWTNGMPVRMGSPYWANFGLYNYQKPNGGEKENCAILDLGMHYYLSDTECSRKDVHPICEQ